MKKKKVISMLLVTTMLLSTLVGCSSGETTDVATADEATESTTTDTSDDAVDESAKPYEGVTLSILIDVNEPQDGLNAVLEMANEQLGLEFEIETRVTGTEGINIVKTRLAAGEMTDLCVFNTGAQFGALNPSEYFIDMSDEDYISRLEDVYVDSATVDGAVYGVPYSSSKVGAVLYYKPAYEELGLSVPSTWDEFLANCEALEEAGKTAVLASYGDSWTSQLLFLADNYNVLADNPDFPEEFEAGTAKYATTEEGVASFQKYLDIVEYYNEDYLATTYTDASDRLVTGDGTHYIITSQTLSAMSALYPDEMDNVGVFPLPGDDPDNCGFTVWMPNSIYGNKDSENVDAIKAFFELYVSDEAIAAYTEQVLPDGPYCVQGIDYPDDVYTAVKDDMQAYFDEGKTCVALEFETSVKGANCPAICQEAGLGTFTALESAEIYDDDCLKQAVQLGLDWE